MPLSGSDNSPRSEDDRLVYGAVIPGELWFDIGPKLDASMYGRAALAGPGSIHLAHSLQSLGEVALESPDQALGRLTGALSISSQRADLGYLGRIDRRAAGLYAVEVHLFEAEMVRVLSLLAAGLRPRRLKLEFDSLFDQGFERENYWDDERYPRVELSEFALDWSS